MEVYGPGPVTVSQFAQGSNVHNAQLVEKHISVTIFQAQQLQLWLFGLPYTPG
jgi:hypothetical protein